MALAKRCKSVADMYTHVRTVALPGAPLGMHSCTQMNACMHMYMHRNAHLREHTSYGLMCAMLLYGPERHPIALFGQWACVEPNGSGPPTTALGPAVLGLWSPLPMYIHMYTYMYAMQ